MVGQDGSPATRLSPILGKRPGYRQISTELATEIQAGQWPIGTKLPTEQALLERFGVSRNTVREALRELRDFGYLSKRRGTPSVVIRTVPEDGFLNSVRSVDELLEYANAASNTLLSAETIILMDEQARQLDCAPRSTWLRLQMLRRRNPDDLPFCYSEVFIDPRYAGVADRLDGLSVYAAIERDYDVVIGRVVQDVQAAAATENIALRLQVPVGSPILQARSTFHTSDGSVIEVGMAHFATGRYRLRIALDRRRGGGPDDRDTQQ